MQKFWVRAGARLHLGQFDMNGSLGRLYGGFGLAVDSPKLEITAEKSEGVSIFCSNDVERNRAEKIARKYIDYYNLPGVSIEIHQSLPTHCGLGSGTQFCLAIGFAISRVYGLHQSIMELAGITDRESSRSGIGVAAFEYGGFLVDGGKDVSVIKTEKDNGVFSIPPLLVRLKFPQQWAVIIALPDNEKKVSGSEEAKAFLNLSPMDEAISGSICRLLLMSVLPALKEQDLDRFGAGISSMQAYIGDYFAPLQGGRFGSGLCESLANFMMKIGLLGVGHSSWGPVIYGFTSQESSAYLVHKIEKFLDGHGTVWVANGRNKGATWGWK